MAAKLEWNKIISQVIATIFSIIIAGACAIIWKGATTVDDKINIQEQKFNALILILEEENKTLINEVKALNEKYNHIISYLKTIQSNTERTISPIILPEPTELTIRREFTIPQLMDQRIRENPIERRF